MHVTLRQLQTFEAVARLRSFSRAAEEMHVTQPTVSKQIRLLHEQVGLPLIEQLGKKIFLTEAGRELYATCADWLDTWGRFGQTIANLKGLKQGRLKIAAVTTTKYFMPRILGPFCAQFPDIDIALEVVNRDRLLNRLSHNEDDLYIMGVPPEGMEMESEPFMSNPLVVIAPVNHPLADQKQVPLSRVAMEPFVVRERGSGTRMTTEKVFRDHELSLKIKMELGSNEAIKQAVAGGLGLALLSRSTLNHDPGQEGLAVLNVEGFPVMRAWYVVRQKGKQMSVVAGTFLEFLREHLQIFSSHQSQVMGNPGGGASPMV